MLNVLDLFSGIGGFSLGLEKAGMKTVAFCEIDKKCHSVLNKNFPNIPIFGDINGLYLAEQGLVDHDNYNSTIKKIDVICGGFPCQDICIGGKQKGFFDENGKIIRSGTEVFKDKERGAKLSSFMSWLSLVSSTYSPSCIIAEKPFFRGSGTRLS